jgi:hypothetical protein
MNRRYAALFLTGLVAASILACGKRKLPADEDESSVRPPPRDAPALAASGQSAEGGAPSSVAAAEAASGDSGAASTSLRAQMLNFAASSWVSSHFSPQRAFDDDPKTAWNDHLKGPVQGEWVEVTFASEVIVDVVEMATGWDYVSPKDGDLFAANAHFRRVRLEFSGGATVERDVGEGERSVRIEAGGRRTTRLRIVAADVYPGTRWQDLCLSDAKVIGRAVSRSGAIAAAASTEDPPVQLHGRCSPGRTACVGASSGLFCAVDGTYKSMSCSGEGGCSVQGAKVVCDNDTAAVGDGCDTPNDGACAMDRRGLLQCKGEKFVLIDTCKGPGACTTRGDMFKCDNYLADVGDR